MNLNLILIVIVTVIVMVVRAGWLVRAILKRNARDNFRSPAAVAGPNLERAAQQSRSFPHAQQAHRLSVGNLLIGNPATVVFHFQNNPSSGLAQFHFDLGGAGMADDVRERFLKDAEQGGV